MYAGSKDLVDSSTPDTFRLAQTSYIYSDDGTQLAALAESEDATYLSYEDIPADVVNAFVSVEDRTFWNNSGVDYKGILRVCVNYVKTKGQVAEGASTITQQLARGTFLSNEKTISRKIKEIFIARQLTKKYTKEQIMEFYCNSCCFANGIYGVEDASQKYFGRSVSDLSLSETAYICAIPNRPEYYNPLKNSENAISRRNKILQDMYECDYITKDAGDAALAENITVAEVSDEEDTFYNYEATYAINCAIRYLMKQDGFEFKSHFEDDADYDTYNAYYDEMYKQAKHKLYTGGFLVLAGAVPSQMPGSIYEQICAKLQNRGVHIVVDTTGDALLAVLDYHPFLIKPNHHELGEIFGEDIRPDDEEKIRFFAAKLQEKGARNVLVSRGKYGATLLAEDGSTHSVGVVPGKPVNNVGCGDSMVAGFLAGYADSGDYKTALKWASAAGNASAFCEGVADGDTIRRYKTQYFAD